MTTKIRIRDGVLTRRDSADHDVDNAMRRLRQEIATRRADGKSPFNEGFSFTHRINQRIKPLDKDMAKAAHERDATIRANGVPKAAETVG